MNRDEICGIIKKHLADTIDDLDVDSIDTSRSMVEYGASSLDLVDIVSRSMREMKVKLPRAELSELTNIDGLIDLFAREIAKRDAEANANTAD